MCCHSVLLCYGGESAISNAIGYAEHDSRSHDAVIRVYDAAGNLIEAQAHKGGFQTTAKYYINLAPLHYPEVRMSFAI